MRSNQNPESLHLGRHAETISTRALMLLTFITVVTGIGCTWYKPEIESNKCVVNEECGQGFACRAGRCEDIYYPKRKIRQY